MMQMQIDAGSRVARTRVRLPLSSRGLLGRDADANGREIRKNLCWRLDSALAMVDGKEQVWIPVAVEGRRTSGSGRLAVFNKEAAAR